MKISVLISTFNRCESLKDTLVSLVNQECNDNFEYEVIVIDNNSKDETKEVIELYRNKFKNNLAYYFEPKQGKAFALNLGIKKSTGDILAFTDDDVLLDKYWLLGISETFKRYNVDIVGGAINPLWLDEKPKWLTSKFYGMLPVLNYGDSFFSTRSRKNLAFGANCAFKKLLFDKYGLYDERMYFSQDTEICNRFLKNGAIFSYNPKIISYHKINKNRFSKDYFRKWHFHRGKLSIYIENPAYISICMQLFDKFISFIWCGLKRDIENCFYHEVKMIYLIGQIQGKLGNRLKINE